MLVSKSTLLHLRFPFSYYLLPVYMLGLAVSPSIELLNAVLIFIILHLLMFPASNGFNSYYDRDEESIGGLKRPPRVTPDLLWAALALDALALILAFFVHPLFAAGCFIYGLASKAYSWDRLRIKRFPFAGWLATGLGQGSFVFLLVFLFAGGERLSDISSLSCLVPAAVSGLFMLGYYPLTQVYQHGEDKRRGDRTISVLLGTRGTFFLALSLLASAISVLCVFLASFFPGWRAWAFGLFQVPAGFYALFWFARVLRDPLKADFTHAMRMNLIASSSINLFCALSLIMMQAGA